MIVQERVHFCFEKSFTTYNFSEQAYLKVEIFSASPCSCALVLKFCHGFKIHIKLSNQFFSNVAREEGAFIILKKKVFIRRRSPLVVHENQYAQQIAALTLSLTLWAAGTVLRGSLLSPSVMTTTI